MSHANPIMRPNAANRKTWLLVLLFVVLTAAGLAYVKWWPYYGKALTAADKHSIGGSILKGSGADHPLSIWQSSLDYAQAYFKAIWKAAVLGMIVGSMVQVLLPANWLLKVLGRTSMRSTLIGGVSSLPGMMCTCCAAPIAAGLRKQQVSAGASLAFWLGNPLLNPATLIFMTFVLSWKFTLLRLAFGLLITFGVSYAANRFEAPRAMAERLSKQLPDAEAAPRHGSLWAAWFKSLFKMAVTLVPVYIVAVLALGVLQSFDLPAWLHGGLGAILFFAIAGTLFVIPTAAEIPIIQSFLSLGVSAGPAAVLLVTLPAVSLPSLLLVAGAFPRKVLGFVTSSVVVLGILCGFIGELVL
ncbi:permease [Paenibacillus sp. GCM10023250]|uniref:permease n=1 Tax=Paenibacillus sp. GCM10023250 TaxID=3252648 RepID=UPI00361DC43C